MVVNVAEVHSRRERDRNRRGGTERGRTVAGKSCRGFGRSAGMGPDESTAAGCSLTDELDAADDGDVEEWLAHSGSDPMPPAGQSCRSSESGPSPGPLRWGIGADGAVGPRTGCS